MNDARPATRAVDPLRLRVGEDYDSGIRRWPGQELILTTQGCLMLVDCPAPTPEKIAEFATSTAYFAWFEGRHNGILCFRFGDTPWHFMPFNPHRDTPAGMVPGPPAIMPGQGLPIAMGFADCSPVLAVRVVHWPDHFVAAVRATIARLAAQPFDADQTVNESNNLYLYVGSRRLAQRAAVSIRCRPG